jgi:hypothetical protein
LAPALGTGHLRHQGRRRVLDPLSFPSKTAAAAAI